MRRFPPPRSGVRRAFPSPSFGRKKQPRIVFPAGSHLGPGRLQRMARRVARQHRGARQSRPCPCGERVADSMVTLLAYGSPPPMRGMPARTAFFCSSIGSPPHTRGKSALPPDGNLSLRSTPAHAGNCPVLRNPGRNAAPRITPARAGNCPVLRNPGRNAAPRITPACAGKRRPSHVYSQPFWDHPCLCTEKICYEAPEDEKNGSPPPMRGKDLRLIAAVGILGITPPRIRGKVSIDITTISSYRITPAHAGKRLQKFPSYEIPPDHPRVCGEKLEPPLSKHK